MPSRAMHVTVFEFLVTGIPDTCDFDIKGQLFTGQWVIAINIDVEAADFQYGYLNRTFICLQRENLPD